MSDLPQPRHISTLPIGDDSCRRQTSPVTEVLRPCKRRPEGSLVCFLYEQVQWTGITAGRHRHGRGTCRRRAHMGSSRAAVTVRPNHPCFLRGGGSGEAVDRWAAAQEDKPGRSEAIRRLLNQALGIGPKRTKMPGDNQDETGATIWM